MKALAVILLVIFGIPVALYNGFMLTFMWKWFIVPLGLPIIGVLQAWGLLLTSKFFTINLKREEGTSEDAIIKTFITLIASLFISSFLTLVGLIIHWFM